LRSSAIAFCLDLRRSKPLCTTCQLVMVIVPAHCLQLIPTRGHGKLLVPRARSPGNVAHQSSEYRYGFLWAFGDFLEIVPQQSADGLLGRWQRDAKLLEGSDKQRADISHDHG